MMVPKLRRQHLNSADQAMTEEEHDSRMGKAITRGILTGIPVSVLLLAAAIWLLGGEEIGDALATSLLPGTLLGVFGGGFAGMALTME